MKDSTTIRPINSPFLDSLSAQAAKNPRLRKNFNFHKGAESLSQQLLNAMEPGTVIFECKDGSYVPLGKEDMMTQP